MDELMTDPYDVVVVGGGAAGLSGALMLARSRRSVLVIDAGEPRNAPAAGVHGYLTREGASPASLLATGREEVRGGLGDYIDSDATGLTLIPGVWVAGNVTDPKAQVISSAAAGVTAGAAINADLIADEVQRAVAARRDPSPGSK